MLQDLKRKDFHTILMDLSSPYLPSFFARCREIGLHGEDRNFFLASLNFRQTISDDDAGDDEEEGEEETHQAPTVGPDPSLTPTPTMAPRRDRLKSFYYFRLANVADQRERVRLAKLIRAGLNEEEGKERQQQQKHRLSSSWHRQWNHLITPQR